MKKIKKRQDLPIMFKLLKRRKILLIDKRVKIIIGF